MKQRRYIGIILVILMLCIPMTGSAEIAGPEVFENLVWEQVFQDDLHGGVVAVGLCDRELYYYNRKYGR